MSNRKKTDSSDLRRILGNANYKRLETLRAAVEQRENFLKSILKGKYTEHSFGYGPTKTNQSRFIIARKWNSWYPSYFDIQGGCYAFLLPGMERTGVSEQSGPSAIVIDPGFKFLEALRQYGVNASDISAIIVTHYHMDHMAGLVEFLTLINEQESGPICRIYMNETVFESYRSLQTKNVEFCELRADEKILIGRYKRVDGLYECLYLTPFRSHHREMGARSNTLGLLAELCVKNSQIDQKNLATSRIALLGDTDGLPENLEEYAKRLEGNDIIVLHLGTIGKRKIFQRYSAGDSHLYDAGVARLLSKISRFPKSKSPLAVVISEFGFELSRMQNYPRIIKSFAPPNDWLLFLNLLYCLDQEIKGNSDVQDLELQVFGLLAVDYFIRKLWLSEHDKTTQRNMSVLFGLFAYISDAKGITSSHENNCRNILKRIGIGAPGPFTEKRSSEMITMILSDHLCPANEKVEKLAEAFVSLLMKHCEESAVPYLLDSLYEFIMFIGHRTLRQMIARRFVFIYFPATRISKKIAERYSFAKRASFHDMRILKHIPISYGCLNFLIAILERIKLDPNRSKATEVTFPIEKHEDFHFFDELTKIFSEVTPAATSLLIGDIGFDAMYEFKKSARKYNILLKTEGSLSKGVRQEYTEIRNTRCEEDEEGTVRYYSNSPSHISVKEGNSNQSPTDN